MVYVFVCAAVWNVLVFLVMGACVCECGVSGVFSFALGVVWRMSGVCD